MPTQSEKQHARERREQAQAAAAAAALRARNVRVLAGVVFAALVAVVAGVIIAGGRKPNEVDPGSNRVAGVAETKTLLRGVEQRGLTLGKASAPLTLVEFLDVQCPFCREHQLDVQPAVIDRLVRPGRVQLKAQPIAIPTMGEDSVAGRAVLLRLSHEHKAWDFLNLFYWNQGNEGTGYVTDAYLTKLVKAIPGAEANTGRATDPRDAATVAQVERDAQTLGKHYAQAGKEFGTPAFALGRTGAPFSTYKAVFLSGGNSATELEAAVQKAERG